MRFKKKRCANDLKTRVGDERSRATFEREGPVFIGFGPAEGPPAVDAVAISR